MLTLKTSRKRDGMEIEMGSEYWIVLIGDPIEGDRPWGPFGSWKDATRWIADCGVEESWSITKLENPDEYC